MKAAYTYMCMSFDFDNCDYVDFASPNLLLLTVGGSLRAAEDVAHVGQPTVADVTTENNNVHVDSEDAITDDSSDQDHESESDIQEDPGEKIEHIVLEDQQPDNQDMLASTQEAQPEPASSSVPPPPPPVPSEPAVRRPRARRAVVTERGPQNERHGQASIFGPNTVFIGSITFVERTDQQAGLQFHKMHASTRVPHCSVQVQA